MTEPKIHKSVMVDEAVASLHIKNQANYIDATLATGGHASAILEKGGRVLGIDMDPNMIGLAQERLSAKFNPGDFKLVTGNFSELRKIAEINGWDNVWGVIFDLGVSNLHLKDLSRGFSFDNPEAILDMRLNPDKQGVRANDLLNVLRNDQLEEMFSEVLEPGISRWLTKKITAERQLKKIETVGDFLNICAGLRTGKTGIRQETLPFLALRIAVNGELDNLRNALPEAFELIEHGARIAVITFHSGEDRIVKDFARNLTDGKLEETLTASETEILDNPRSRSARLRVIKKYEKDNK